MHQKTQLSKISNTIFLILSILILSFIWLNYYLHNIRLSIISSLIVISAFCIAYFSIRTYTQRKLKSKNQIIKDKEDIRTTLIFSSFQDNLNLIKNLFNIEIIKRVDDNHYLSQDKDIFIFLVNHKLLDEDILKIIKSRQFNNIEIYTIQNPSIMPLPEDITLRTITFDEIYEKLLNSSSIKIDISIFKKTPKLSLKNYICIILKKERSRGYFSFGILILFSSLFTIYQTYYIVIGTLLILLSLYSRFNNKYNN